MKSPKFKAGEVAVIAKNFPLLVPETGTTFSEPVTLHAIYGKIVNTVPGTKCRILGMVSENVYYVEINTNQTEIDESYLVSLEIYNSPLYKALNEK